MVLPRLEPGSPVGDQVFDALRDAIVGGRLPAGHRLRIRDLAEELGTSVMPVREAISRLREAGLAETIPYRGAVVKEFTRQELLDLYAVRRTLEREATVLGTGLVTDDDLATMRAALGAMREALAAGRAREYLAHDEAFLAVLYARCGNQVLVEMIASLWTRCLSYKVMGTERELAAGDTSPLLRNQADLLQAVSERDAERAGLITTQSLDAARERIRGAFET